MSAPAAAADSSAPTAAASAASSGSKRFFPDAAADSNRRVQPRHFHAGPNPAAAVSSTGDQAASDPPPAAAARLYRHALESIFAFLDQRELATALRVSHSWLAAVTTMASLRLTVAKPSAPLRVVAESAMGRHVTGLNEMPVTIDSLFIAARLMPQLCELSCKLELSPSVGPLSFPSGLRELRMVIVGKPEPEDVNAALEAVGRLSLLEAFFLHLEGFDGQLSFAPLASLPLLRVLWIFVPDDVDLSDAHVAQLRAMPLLRRLDVWSMSTSLLRRLLAQPHDLQWQEITLRDPLDDEAAALLPQLPSLTALQPHVEITCERFDFLRQLPNLTRVHLHIDDPSPAGCIESLVAELQCCTRIEELGLRSMDLTAAHLADLLPRLPRLRWLSLYELDIDSLSFLAQEPMTQQLTSLTLSRCRRLPLTEMRHVHSLRALKSLCLVLLFNAPMDALSLSLHTPPSSLMPQLEKFVYTQ